MQFRSVRDMADTIRENLHRVPSDVDLVVCIPRSGIVPATLFALSRNLRITDVDGALEGRLFGHGERRASYLKDVDWPPKHMLVIDDSVGTGGSIATVKEKLAPLAAQTKITYMAVYGTEEGAEAFDIVLEIIPLPRIFEWNLFHHRYLRDACLDIDGVLCEDPAHHQNDDGDAYRDFLLNAEPRFLPTVPVAYLVSSRREAFRKETEEWMRRHNVQYGELILLNETAQDRSRFGLHAKHKAAAYRRLRSTRLFIESDMRQAQEIARLSGKPVISTEQMVLFNVSRGHAYQVKIRSRLEQELVKYKLMKK